MQDNNLSQFPLVELISEKTSSIKKLANLLRKHGIFSEYFPSWEDHLYAERLEGPSLPKIYLMDLEIWKKLEVSNPKFLEEHFTSCLIEDADFLSNEFVVAPLFQPVSLQTDKVEISILGFLKQIQLFQKREKQVWNLHQQIKSYREKVASLEETISLSKLKKIGSDEISNIQAQILQINPNNNFIAELTKVLDAWQNLTHFGLLFWDEESEKMSSPEILSPKYRPMEDVWDRPLQTQSQHNLVSNLATEKAITIFGSHFVPLEVTGPNQFPTLLIYLLFENDQIYGQDCWQQIELSLNFALSKYYLEKNNDRYLLQKVQINPFDFFQRLQQFYQGQKTKKDRLLYYLDFAQLMKQVHEREENFKWSTFYHGFLQGLLIMSNSPFQLCIVGIQHWFFISTSEQEIEFLKIIKTYSLEFPYWQYFQETQNIISLNLVPKIYGVSLSRLLNEKNILNIFLQKSSTVFHNTPQKSAGVQGMSTSHT